LRSKQLLLSSHFSCICRDSDEAVSGAGIVAPVTPLASSSPTEVTETESEATQRLLLLTVLQNILSHTSDGIIVAFILQEAYERLDFFLNAREGDLRILRNREGSPISVCPYHLHWSLALRSNWRSYYYTMS